MIKKYSTYLLTILFCILAFAKMEAHDWVMEGKAVAALGNLGLYKDSTFSSNTVSFYKEGALFKFLGETKKLHEDDSQKQLYKWYKVKSLDGKTGWLFGDMVVVMLPDDKVSDAVENFNKKKFDFKDNFGESAIWVGAVTGRDIVSLNGKSPVYREEFLMVTNESGKSKAIVLNSNNLFGSTHLRKMEIEDVTGDDIPEILLQRISYSKKDYYSNLNAEIYAFDKTNLVKVFEEAMNLSSQGSDSPLKYKYLDAKPGKIRFEYMMAVDCSGGTKCLKHFTDTYFWNADKFMFEALRAPYRTPVKAVAKNKDIALLRKPGDEDSFVTYLNRDNMMRVLREESKTIMVDGKAKQQIWFYVKGASGKLGYVSAKEIEFINISHAALLNGYYHSPTSVIDERKFIKVETSDGFSNR